MGGERGGEGERSTARTEGSKVRNLHPPSLTVNTACAPRVCAPATIHGFAYPVCPKRVRGAGGTTQPTKHGPTHHSRVVHMAAGAALTRGATSCHDAGLQQLDAELCLQAGHICQAAGLGCGVEGVVWRDTKVRMHACLHTHDVLVEGKRGLGGWMGGGCMQGTGPRCTGARAATRKAPLDPRWFPNVGSLPGCTPQLPRGPGPSIPWCLHSCKAHY